MPISPISCDHTASSGALTSKETHSCLLKSHTHRTMGMAWSIKYFLCKLEDLRMILRNHFKIWASRHALVIPAVSGFLVSAGQPCLQGLDRPVGDLVSKSTLEGSWPMTPEDDLWPSHLHPMYNPHEHPCLQIHTHCAVYFLHQFRTYPSNVSNSGSNSRVFGLLAHAIGLSYHGCLLSGVFLEWLY